MTRRVFSGGALAMWAGGATAELPAGVGEMKSFTATRPPRPAPDLAFQALDGTPARLADLAGRVVVLNIWATWCPPCIRELPSLGRLQAQFRPSEVAVLAVSVDTGGPETVARFLAARRIPDQPPVMQDADLAALGALKIRSLPSTVLYDRKLRELGRLIGPADWASPEAVALVRAATLE